MTKEEIMELNFEQVEERRSAIVEEIETADSEALDVLNEELDAIEERKAVLKREADEKREAMKEVIKGDGEIVEEVKEERETMDNIEIRSTPEYLDAWVENLKGRASEEQRVLLTENAVNGTIAVPVYVDNTIHTAWENNEILRRIRRTYYPGNLKVGYEASAGGAQSHDEGDGAIEEENLVLGIVELLPTTIKKWISFSDEALDMRGEAFVDYIVDEITDKILKGIINELVMAATTSTIAPTIQPATPNVLTTADLINATASLGGEASNPVVITTRAKAAALKVAALSANYGYDPFDGMEVLYTDVSNFASIQAIVADLSGFQANFVNGDDVKIKIDDLTLATSDMVKVIGRVMVGVGVVAPGKVVVIDQ